MIFFKELQKHYPLQFWQNIKTGFCKLRRYYLDKQDCLSSQFQEKYPLMLQKEYRFYQKKYKLKPIDGELFFLRMRPANFPTIRLAQLSMLIHESEHLFSKIKKPPL